MASSLEKVRVKGGVVTRSAKTGRFVSVTTSKSTSYGTAKSGKLIGEASTKRSSAMKRLVNR